MPKQTVPPHALLLTSLLLLAGCMDGGVRDAMQFSSPPPPEKSGRAQMPPPPQPWQSVEWQNPNITTDTPAPLSRLAPPTQFAYCCHALSPESAR